MTQTSSTCPSNLCRHRNKFGYCTLKGPCVMAEAKMPIRKRETNNKGNCTRVEFIESYLKIGNTDYQWNDNHGELIRCRDCKYYRVDGDDAHYCSRIIAGYAIMHGWKPDDYCSRAERRI